MEKQFTYLLIVALLISLLIGCANQGDSDDLTITLAAAASLKNALDEDLIPIFEDANPGIKVQATYDSSGKLQSQIEEGADIDVFMSAAMKQMNELEEAKLVDSDSIVELLENKIVLIVPKTNSRDINSFEDIVKAEEIAIGDPASVPAGQYAEEALVNLSLWEEVASMASFGTNVTEVLNWVAEASADAGIVYATDAASNDNVKLVAEAPEGSVSKAIYPIGIVSRSDNKDAAGKFIDFMTSDQASQVFESYGFTRN